MTHFSYELFPAVIGYVLGARLAANVLPRFKFVGVAVVVAFAVYSTHPNVAAIIYLPLIYYILRKNLYC